MLALRGRESERRCLAQEEKCWLAITSHVNMRCNKQLKGRSISGHTSDNIIFYFPRNNFTSLDDRVNPRPRSTTLSHRLLHEFTGSHRSHVCAALRLSFSDAGCLAGNRNEPRPASSSHFATQYIFDECVKHIRCLSARRALAHSHTANTTLCVAERSWHLKCEYYRVNVELLLHVHIQEH